MTKGTQRKILIIEDEKALQDVLRDQIEDEGYMVAEALTGEEGLRRYEEWNPDVVILDIILPRTDGFAILEKLRKSKIPSGPPIIVLTNLADEPNLQRIQSYLVASDICLVKSNTAIGDVIEAIKQVLA